jgi:hypothetical protein
MTQPKRKRIRKYPGIGGGRHRSGRRVNPIQVIARRQRAAERIAAAPPVLYADVRAPAELITANEAAQ